MRVLKSRSIVIMAGSGVGTDRVKDTFGEIGTFVADRMLASGPQRIITPRHSVLGFTHLSNHFGLCVEADNAIQLQPAESTSDISNKVGRPASM